MAIFGLKKKDANKDKAAAPATVKAAPAKAKKPVASKAVATVPAQKGTPSVDSGAFSLASVILRPRVTEKSGILSQGGVYTFEVSTNATKATVSKAVKAIYKVTPVKVAMITLPVKNVFIRGRRGTVAGVRKAMVTVKKGEKIDFV